MDCIFPQRIQKALNLPPIQNIFGALPKNPSKPPWEKRPANTINEIVIHHSASTGTLAAEANYHINNRGWYTLSYHFSIDRGNIYQINDPLSITWHASGANTNGIGICVNWDLRKRPLTQFERDAVIGLVLVLKEMFPTITKVSGHNEVGKRNGYATACPVISMDKLREDIMTVENEIAYNESPQKKEEIAFRLMNQMTYFYNLSRGKNPDGTPATEGNKAWGLNMILSMETEFRKRGFLK